MRVVASELITIAFFVVVGWGALWPSRRRLGPLLYHLAALPMGVLAAPLSGAVSTVTGRPLDVPSAVVGGLVLVAAMWAVQHMVLHRDETVDSPVAPWTYAAAAGSIGVAGFVVGVANFTVTNYDSIVAFWPLGSLLNRTGAFDAAIASARSPLIPSMSAIHIAFGSGWAYAIYTMLGLTLALWLAVTLWVGPVSGATRKTKLLVAGGALGFLVLEPSFLFHSFFVHSHMLSAVYLLMALTSLWLAVRPGAMRTDGAPENAYLLLAGAFAAGFALTRPDGLAYQFVPVAVAISVLTLSKVRWRSVAAYFGPHLLVVLGVYGVAYAELGMWKASKLSGGPAMAILAGLALSAAGPWIVEAIDRAIPIRFAGERFLGILVGVAAVLTLVIVALNWDAARLTLANARINLLQGAGGYNYLWWAVLLLLMLSLVSRDAARFGTWTRSPFLAIALFIVVAVLIHVMEQNGRIGVGDSLNRVAFGIVPVVVWYVAAIVARILGPGADAETR